MEKDRELLDLLKIVEESSTRVIIEPKYNKSIAMFMAAFDIRRGEEEVPNYLLYYYYCAKWAPTGTKLSKIEFMRLLKQYLPYKRKSLERCFLIESTIENTIEMRMRAKQYDKKYHGKNKKTDK